MNPFLGIFYHAVGGFAAGSFYIPFNKVKVWAWEVYWLLGGFFAWIVMPLLLTLLIIESPLSFFQQFDLKTLFWPYFFGVLWGIGGLTFGLTMRFLGMSLGMALALGLTATFGTLVPPVYYGQMGELISRNSGVITLIGVAVCIFGIAITGKAGVKKDGELSDDEKKAQIKEFNFQKGVWVAFFAGVMSACFAFGIAAGKSIAETAVEQGAVELMSNSPVFLLIMAGGFTTNLVWCLYLGVRNRSYIGLGKVGSKVVLNNIFFSALAGITWYFQFMFYGMGTTKMGEYDFASWTIHMAFIIVFSNMWGLILKEWKGSSSGTIRLIVTGIAILILSTIVVGIGNYIQQFE
jgi:L-rhamnose-H+ transport protein